MPKKRNPRMKEVRPQQLIDAAFEVFVEKGFASARIDDVTRRAGVSKGLLYRYFESKEALLKAVVKSTLEQQLDSAEAMDADPGESARALMRGPLVQLFQSLPKNKTTIALNALLLAENVRHPDIASFYWEFEIKRVLDVFSGLLDRGIKQGEFPKNLPPIMPYLVLAPVFFSVTWTTLYPDQPIDTDELIETHMDMLLKYLAVSP